MANVSAFVGTLLIGTAVPAILRWLYSSAARQEVERDGDDLTFPASSNVIGVIRWGAVAVGTAFLAGTPWTSKPGAVVIGVVGALFLVGGHFCRAVPVVLSKDGVSGPSIWNQETFVPWSEVNEIEFQKAKRVTKVVGAKGSEIYHSGFHADPERFRQELKERTHLLITVVEPGLIKSRITHE